MRTTVHERRKEKTGESNKSTKKTVKEDGDGKYECQKGKELSKQGNKNFIRLRFLTLLGRSRFAEEILLTYFWLRSLTFP